ncbi:hypothetical protein NDU88_000911 [Pleurodeles waltl]|uniref:Secreted protein n=1 Tax=Pleurodeles waltl TaxID=8319 RepID=A0AAV7WGU5_PLEWA|nr:hypothetical protein NDU88_000911 [Pleurodeles waltl]
MKPGRVGRAVLEELWFLAVTLRGTEAESSLMPAGNNERLRTGGTHRGEAGSDPSTPIASSEAIERGALWDVGPVGRIGVAKCGSETQDRNGDRE